VLKINSLTIRKTTGPYIIKDLSLVVNKEDRLAIIGEEGNGKSTLLKILAGDDVSDYIEYRGVIDKQNERIGYLKQSLSQEELDLTILDYMKVLPNYDEVIGDFYRLWSYFHLPKEILEENHILRTVSGGERVKIQIIRLLLSDPTILILDEPTNDLDLSTLMWLEEFINNFNGGVIYVSHDESLLENTATSILHLELIKTKQEPRHTYSKCGYQEYVQRRQLAIDKQNQLSKMDQKKKKEKEEILRKIHNRVEFELNQAVRDPSLGRLLAKKMRNVKAQERKVENMEVREHAVSEEQINIFFDNVEKIPANKRVIEYTTIGMAIGDRVLSNFVQMSIYGPEKVAIIGDNGVGKTTLLYNLLKVLAYTPGLIVAYMPQNYDEILPLDMTPVEYLVAMTNSEKENITKIHNYLGACRFLKEEMDQKNSNLSGGQKAKLALIGLILSCANVLVLDEPTRNLSPLSGPIIRKILKEYKGCIISVSHDRKYIEEVADTVYELTPEELKKIV